MERILRKSVGKSAALSMSISSLKVPGALMCFVSKGGPLLLTWYVAEKTYFPNIVTADNDNFLQNSGRFPDPFYCKLFHLENQDESAFPVLASSYGPHDIPLEDTLR